ncbi:MAG: hypothetical protein ABJA66_11600 [Actinomycetota bacterium]
MKSTKKIQNLESAEQKAFGIELECAAQAVLPGCVVGAKVKVKAGLEAISVSGVFIDLYDSEEIALKNISNNPWAPLAFTYRAMNESFRVAPSFQLGANETKTLEGKFRLPINFQPTFAGQFARHDWQIRARVETTSGDADSGFQKFIIGAGF